MAKESKILHYDVNKYTKSGEFAGLIKRCTIRKDAREAKASYENNNTRLIKQSGITVKIKQVKKA
jgi:hypothetical protein